MTGQLHIQPTRDDAVPAYRQSLHSEKGQRKVPHPKIIGNGCIEEPPKVEVESEDYPRDRPSSPMWPPKGLELQSKLALEEATTLISEGALAFRGFIIKASHTSREHVRKYATVGVGAAHKEMAVERLVLTPADMSLTLLDRVENMKPWSSLEQPSMAQCFGLLPGTITLGRYIDSMSRTLRTTAFPDYAVQPRQTDSLLVLQRLHYLQGGLDADSEVTEEVLYTQLVHDPGYQKGAPGSLEQEMAVLVAALNNPVWIDFRETKSQVLARFFDTQNLDAEKLFYQQLLLSVELSLRIQALMNWAEGSTRVFGPTRAFIVPNIPEKVAWDLALATVWQKRMTLVGLDDSFYKVPTTFGVTCLSKNIQIDRLLSFARSMKWAGIAELECMLGETAEGVIPLESRSLYSASWMTGAILPGASASLLIMRSLLDCDPNVSNMLQCFNQMHPNLGIQYHGNTFWHWESIVAKVLGACKGVKHDYGWVGPCLASNDLDPFEIVLARSESLRRRMSTSHVESMSARSAALGPPTAYYQGCEYTLPLPDLTNVIDEVIIHKLAFRSCSAPTPTEQPETLHAAVIFTIGNESIPIRLRYNVSFICAPACHGTHPLFWDYAYEIVKADELVMGKRSRDGITTDSTSSSNLPSPSTSGFERSCRASIRVGPRGPEAILVVEAYGAADNQVLARAWASHLGYSAVVANVKETCMACAIRMAYAAAIPLLILNDGHHNDV